MSAAPSRTVAASAALAGLCLAGLVAGGCVERKVAAVTAPGDLRIVSLEASPDTIFIDQQAVITATIDNPEGGRLSYSWQAYRGAVAGDGPQVQYFGSYCCAGTDWVVLSVRNDAGEQDARSVVLHVIPEER